MDWSRDQQGSKVRITTEMGEGIGQADCESYSWKSLVFLTVTLQEVLGPLLQPTTLSAVGWKQVAPFPPATVDKM